MECECGSTEFIEKDNLEIRCKKCGKAVDESSRKMKCECGSTEFIEDEVHLEVHCKKCGLVLDEKLNYHIKRPYAPRFQMLGGYSRKL